MRKIWTRAKSLKACLSMYHNKMSRPDLRKCSVNKGLENDDDYEPILLKTYLELRLRHLPASN